ARSGEGLAATRLRLAGTLLAHAYRMVRARIAVQVRASFRDDPLPIGRAPERLGLAIKSCLVAKTLAVSLLLSATAWAQKTQGGTGPDAPPKPGAGGSWSG